MTTEGVPGSVLPHGGVVYGPMTRQQQMDAAWEELEESRVALAGEESPIAPLNAIAAQALQAWDEAVPRPPKQHRHRGKRREIKDLDRRRADRHRAAQAVKGLVTAAVVGDTDPLDAYLVNP